MFSSYDTTLKPKLKKQLKLISENYKQPTSINEQMVINYTWNKITSYHSNIMIFRIEKLQPRLGIQISTEYESKFGYVHQIHLFMDDGILNKSGCFEVNDVLLEVNGVNVRSIDYNQLAILLSSLPPNIQIVYSRKINNGSTSSNNTSSSPSTSISNTHSHPIKIYFPETLKIIIHLERSKSFPIKFKDVAINPIACCEIDSVNSKHELFKDGRLCPGDCIVAINEKDTCKYTSKQLLKYFEKKIDKTVILYIKKWTGEYDYVNIKNGVNNNNSIDSNPAITPQQATSYSLSSQASSSSNPINVCQTSKSTPNISIHLESSISNQINSTVKCDDTIYEDLDEPMSVIIDGNDDINIYIVERILDHKRHIFINGFQPFSSLIHKLQLNDEIISINHLNIQNLSVSKIKRFLEELHSKKLKIELIIIRNHDSINSNLKPYNSKSKKYSKNKSILEAKQTNSIISTDSDDTVTFRFSETLRRNNNKFNIKISYVHKPVITHIYVKDTKINPGDVIERINDIDVLNKNHAFTATLIRSCGETMNLSLVRFMSSKKENENMINGDVQVHRVASIRPTSALPDKPDCDELPEPLSESELKNNLKQLDKNQSENDDDLLYKL